MSCLAWLPLAEQAGRMRFEWGRIQSNTDWILPIVAFLAIASFVRLMYRRDAVELGRPWRWLLTAVRTAVMFGLLILYLQPQWRTEHEVVHPSRVVLMVDTSLSMGLADAEAGQGAPAGRRLLRWRTRAQRNSPITKAWVARNTRNIAL